MKYEITMYKLLAIFGVAMLVFLSFGFWAGESLGQARGTDIEKMKLPPYCSASSSLGRITVRCTELEDYSALELCSILSTPLKDKIKVVVITGADEE